MPYEQSHYFEIMNKIEKFMFKVADYFELSFEELKHYHYRIYCQQVLGYEFHPIITGKYSKEKLSANINFSDDIAIIVYNPNVKSRGRINYSISHEISHAIMEHYKNGTQTFAELVNEGNYSPEEKVIEYEANVGASLLLLNDYALKDCINSCLTFRQIAHKFEMSYQALTVRLCNYLKFNHECTDYNSKKVVELFKNGELCLSNFINGNYYI